MARKSANNLKKGNYFLPEDTGKEPFLVLTNDHSKSGKHGHAKSRIGCVGLFSHKKKSLTYTSDSNLITPEIQKRTGQLIDLNPADKTASVMDNETYETFDIAYPFDEGDKVNWDKIHKLEADPDMMAETIVEFWDVVDVKFITRVILP